MLRTVKTFNGHNINDGVNYVTEILNPDKLPQAQNAFISQTNADSLMTGVFVVDTAVIAIGIKVVNYANRYALIAQLKGWFRRGLVGDLVATFSDDGLDYLKTCQVNDLIRDDKFPMVFVTTLNTGATTWR